MFAKLKKKIAEEEGVDEEQLRCKMSPGGAQSRGSKETVRKSGDTSPANVSPWGSTSSLASNTSAATASSRKDDGDKGKIDSNTKKDNISSKDEQINRLEEKLDEYSTLLKQAVKSKEEMETTVVNHEEASNKKIQDINVQYQIRRSKMAEKLSGAVKKKDEITQQLHHVEKVNAEFQEQIQRLELTHFKKQEEQEDFQGFQVQELAKVKHMLLISQESLQKCKADLQISNEQLEEKSQAVEKLNTIIHTLTHEKTQALKSKDKLVQSSETLKDHSSKFEKEALLLEERCNSLAKEKQEKKNLIVTLETKLNIAQDELDALKYNHLSTNTQVKKQLEEKDRTVVQLQNKLTILEQRLQDNSLSEDEKVTAIKTERNSLEKKLEETRNKLIDLKLSSSEQISGLEKQISHLNSKITEDQEDKAIIRRDSESSAEKYQKGIKQSEIRIRKLEEEQEMNIQRLKQQTNATVLQKSAGETELLNLQRKFDQSKRLILDQKQNLQDKVARLEAKIIQLDTARDFDKSASEHKIGRLESVNEDYLEKEIEHEKQVTQLEEEKERLQRHYAEQERKTLDAQKQLEKTKLQVDNLQKKLSDAELMKQQIVQAKLKLEEEIAGKANQYKRQSEGYSSIVSKLTDKQIAIDNLQEKHVTDLAEVQRSLSEKDGALGILRENVAQKESQCKEYEEQIKQLDQRLSTMNHDLDNHQQGSEQINQVNEQLKDSISNLQEQLTEKNKTIKMQQQRLSDLKKTLQRELKIQTMSTITTMATSNDSSDETSRGNENYERLKPSPSMTEMAPLDTSSHYTLANNHFNSPADFREINFQYLRHVVFKFMSGTDIECIQLLKAVSVILEFSPQEQRIIRDTLEWKNSWFGARPQRKKHIKLPSGNPHMR